VQTLAPHPDRGKGLEVMTVRSQRGIYRLDLVPEYEKAMQFDNVIISIDIVEISTRLLLVMDYQVDSTQDARLLRSPETSPHWLNLVRTQVDSLKFGTVQITVHDSKVVQIERNEKTRLDHIH
jgi:hypothetical protein